MVDLYRSSFAVDLYRIRFAVDLCRSSFAVDFYRFSFAVDLYRPSFAVDLTLSTICNGPIWQSGEEWWEIHQCAALLVIVQPHELLPPPPPPHTHTQSSDCCGDSQNLEAKKKVLPSFFILFFVSLSLSFGHVVLTLTKNLPDVVDFKRNSYLIKEEKIGTAMRC